jgi:hypothetical protein
MRDYQTAYREMSVASAEKDLLHGRLGEGLNAAIECCDRWARDGRIVLEWIGRDMERETVTFSALKADSERFASLLKKRGIGNGDIVAGLLPRIPELLTVVLGTWRAGAVYQPLFTAFGPKAIETRIAGDTGSGAKLVITDRANRSKLDEVQDCPPVIEVDRTCVTPSSLPRILADEPTGFTPVTLKGDDPFVLLYTSGTTGKPKAVLYPARHATPRRHLHARRDRSEARGQLLEHCRSRLGLRNALRADRPAPARPHDDILRGRLHRRRDCADRARLEHHELCRRTDGISDADGGRSRSSEGCSGYFARCLERGRTAEPGGRAMGEVGPRRAAQGPLWADRDGHAGQQPPRRPARRERGLGRLCHAGLPYGGAGR